MTSRPARNATDWLHRLAELRQRPAVVVGVLSGTSADGIDAAVCRITPAEDDQSLSEDRRGLSPFVRAPSDRMVAEQKGTVPLSADGSRIGSQDGVHARVELLHHLSYPHDPEVHDWIAGSNALGARRLAELNTRLGRRFAEACIAAVKSSGLPIGQIDLVGSHGQTLYHHSHVPGAERCGLQVGDADEIAELTGLPVISDFRARDIAAGGEGAPITPIADLVLFRAFGPHGRRAVLNLGGIANLTVLDDSPARILGFDIGPGNALLDRLARRLTTGQLSFDVDGRLGAAGQVNQSLLDRWLAEDAFLKRRPPKSTGFEMYGDELLDELERRHGRADVDLLATAAEFTSRAIAQAMTGLLDDDMQPAEVVVAGGGALNPDLIRRLTAAVAPRIVTRSDELGVPVMAREAMSFAILAHRTVLGLPSTWPGTTGARHPVVLGKLSFPGCH